MRSSSPLSRVIQLAGNLADVEEGIVYGSPALKVRGKMFACIPVHRSAEPGSLAVRMSFTERDLRLRARPDAYYVTSHYEPHPVVLARLDQIDDEELADLLEVGWQFERSTGFGRSKHS